MRFAVGLLAFAGAVNLAFADDPPAAPASPPSANAPAAPAAAAAAASSAQPAAEAKASTVTVTAQADAQEKHFLAEGYSLEMHHGEKMYCRREEQLGTRLGAKKYCSSAEQLTATERDAHRAMDAATWQKSNPSGK